MNKSIVIQFGTAIFGLIIFGLLCAGHLQFISPLAPLVQTALEPLNLIVHLDGQPQMVAIMWIGGLSLVYGFIVSWVISLFFGAD